MLQVCRTYLMFFAVLFCFTLLAPSIIYAGSIDDLSGYISDQIKGNIAQYQDLLTTKITSNEYSSQAANTAGAALLGAQKFAKQAAKTLESAKAAAQAAQQEAEDFANQLAETVEAAQTAAENLNTTETVAEAAKQEADGLAQKVAETLEVAQQAVENLKTAEGAAKAAAAAAQAPQQEAEEFANQVKDTLEAVQTTVENLKIAETAVQEAQKKAEEFANQIAETLEVAQQAAANLKTAEDAAEAAKQKAEGFANLLTETVEAVQQAEETVEAAQQQINGNYAEVLIVILGDYTGKSDEIQKTMELLQTAEQTAETLYDVASQAKACVDDKCVQNYIATMPEPHVPTMEDMESALDVANLRCSKEVPSKIATVLGNVVGLDGEYAEKFDNDRAKVCQAIEKIYNLKYKLQQLEEIREDGYSLMYKYDKKRFKKKGRKRTVQSSIDLRYYPDIQENYNAGTIFPEFSLNNENSWFKWSNNDRVYLADILNSSNTEGGSSACGDDKPYWFKLANRLKFRLKIADVTETDMQLIACLRVSWRGTRNRELASVTIPAPFGYLDELTQMKDAAAQNAMNSLQNQIADMLGINGKLNSIADQAAAAQAAAQSKAGTVNQPPEGRS